MATGENNILRKHLAFVSFLTASTLLPPLRTMAIVHSSSAPPQSVDNKKTWQPPEQQSHSVCPFWGPWALDENLLFCLGCQFPWQRCSTPLTMQLFEKCFQRWKFSKRLRLRWTNTNCNSLKSVCLSWNKTKLLFSSVPAPVLWKCWKPWYFENNPTPSPCGGWKRSAGGWEEQCFPPQCHDSPSRFTWFR